MIQDVFVTHLINKHKAPAFIDSVGSGSIFGEIVACAVMLPNSLYNDEVDDSKKLPHDTIYRLARELKPQVIYSIGISTAKEIRALKNTFIADKLAMSRAVKNLGAIDALFIDGDAKYSLKICPTEYTIVKGDAKVFGISVASIIAKDFRDHLMIDKYGDRFHRYHIKNNKGYRSPDHLMAIKKWGITPYHRDYMPQIKAVLTGNYDQILFSKYKSKWKNL